MDTLDETKANEAHLKRLRDDPEYALSFAMEGIYGDLEEFKDFIEAHEMMPIIARELLRAICRVDLANKGVDAFKQAIVDAVSNIKDEFDAKIKWDFEQKR